MLRAEDDLSKSMDAESKSYLTIRDWFLEQYPAVREFHIPVDNAKDCEVNA